MEASQTDQTMLLISSIPTLELQVITNLDLSFKLIFVESNLISSKFRAGLEYRGVKAIDPAYALPVDVINRIILNK